MNMKSIFTRTALASAVLLSGCSAMDDKPYIDASLIYDLPSEEGNAVELSPAQASPSTDDTSLTTEDISDAERVAELIEEASAPTEPDAPSESEIFTDEDEDLDSFYISDYAAHDLTAAQRSFTKQSIFVGDSICRGFGEYNITADKRVYARGNLAAWSFYDYVFYYGEDDEEISYSEVLKRTKPRFVFLSMGMNDINITTDETFCENYSRIIEHTLLQSNADVYVCAITPVNSNFTSNEEIDLYNSAMAQYIDEHFSGRVHFIDFGRHLRDEEGKLPEHHSSGDGIHLGPHAYYIALWEMYNSLVADGLY